jgi:hypothetical protein
MVGSPFLCQMNIWGRFQIIHIKVLGYELLL